MFCGKCGAQLPEESVFCSECGSKTDGTGSAVSVAYDVQASSSANQKNKIIGIAVVALAAILLVVVCVSIFGGRSYKSVIKTYVTAQFEGDGKAIMELFPDEMFDALLEESDMTKKELYAEINEELESAISQLDTYYGDWTYSYEIAEVEDATAKEVKSMNEDIEEMFDFTVKDAKTVTVDITIAGDDNEVTTSVDILVYKVGRSWYLGGGDFDSLF